MALFRFANEQDYARFLVAYQGRHQNAKEPRTDMVTPQNGPKSVVREDKAGTPLKARRCPTEEQEQMALIAWSRVHAGTWPDLALLCHYPSGGSRHLLEAVKLKKMGVRAGVPDLFLPSARGGYHSLWIELKARDGRLTPMQKKWSAALSKHGCLVHVCFGLQAAIDVLTAYLQMPATLIQKVTP